MTRSLVAVASAAVVALAAGRAGAQDLEPPPPMATSPSAPTYYNPNTSDQSQDSGLGLEWVYLNADAGGAYTSRQVAQREPTWPSRAKASSAGGAFGIGAGVRLLFFTLQGARSQICSFRAFNLWELNAEAAFHIRIWRIDPYFGVRGGYAFTSGALGSTSVNVALEAARPPT